MNPYFSEPQKAKLPPGVEHHSEPGADVIIWSNKDLLKNNPLFVIFPMIILAFPIFCTWLFSQDLVAALPFLTFVWLGALFLATLMVRRRFWQETLVISDRNITLSRKGFFVPKKKLLRKKDVIRKSYERYHAFDEKEPWYSLYIVYRYKLLDILPAFEGTEQLVLHLRKEERYQLFLYLQTILKKREWPTADEMQERSNQ